MLLQNDLSSDMLRFGASPTLRRVGVFMALAGIGMAAFLLLFPLPARIAHNFLLAAAGTLSAAGCVLALWDERIELDIPANRTYHTRGFRPFTRKRTESLDDFTRLILFTREWRTSGGDIERCFSLRLENGPRGWILFRGRNEEEALDAAHRIAARLMKPLERPGSAAPESSARTRAIVTGMVWLGMISVLVIMLWPVLTGSRPLRRSRTPFEGGRIPAYYETFNRGMALYQQGKHRQAEKQFRAAIKEYPLYAEAYNMLAYAMAAQNNLDAALDNAQRANELAPASGYIEDTVGEMHERRGEWIDAVFYYEHALRHMPPFDSIETHFKLARTLIALRRNPEAKGHLEAAARYPSTRWGRLARQLLDGMKRPDKRH